MKININESGISFNRDNGSNAVLDESILKEIEERLKNINDKVEYSDKIPTDEDIVIWINPEEDPAQEYLIRINDETIASNTVWSSEKVYQQINNMFIQADSHIHFNKDVLDKITERDIANWNSKSNFDGSYKSLIDKPVIPSIEGLASEEYVNEAIENLQLPSNLATKEDIPTNVSELENDSGFITKTELEDKNYLVYDDVTHFALKEEVPTKISELEDDKNIATLNDLHGHNNKTVIDGITSEQVAKWDRNTSFDGDYYSLKNRPNIPTHTSNLQNDSGFISEIPNEYITEAELENKGYLTEHQDISNLATKEELHEHENKNILDSITEEKINSWNNKSSFDGNYNNLTNKPNIPIYTSDLQNDSGFITEIPNEYITETELENKGYLTEHQDLSEYAKTKDIPTKVSELENDNDYISEIPSEYITETELENTINNIEKTVSSDIQPVDNNVTLWINTSENETTTVTRINDETVASNTTWSSEKVNTLISSLKLIKEGNVVKLMLGDIELSNINI